MDLPFPLFLYLYYALFAALALKYVLPLRAGTIFLLGLLLCWEEFLTPITRYSLNVYFALVVRKFIQDHFWGLEEVDDQSVNMDSLTVWLNQIKTKHEGQPWNLIRTIYISVYHIKEDWELCFGVWGSLLHIRPFLALTLCQFLCQSSRK